MRSLILGATGLIGSALVDACERRGDAVLGTWYRRPHHDYAPLDICDEANVIALVEDFQPDAIYLAAGLNQIDFAEAHPDECRAVNEDGAAVVAEAAARCGALASGRFGERTGTRHAGSSSPGSMGCPRFISPSAYPRFAASDAGRRGCDVPMT